MSIQKGMQVAATCSLILLGTMGAVFANTYTTSFTGAAENPISEGGQWINGGGTGLDWSDCAIVNHMAVGAQINAGATGTSVNDSTAILKGTWGPNQSVSGTVYFDRSGSLNNNYVEIELRLRTTISAHWCSGYEILYSANIMPFRSGYVHIVRWNGPYNDFTEIGNGIVSTQVDLYSGYVVSATISNSVIKAYINGTNFLTVTDSNPFTNGNPGIGFDLYGDFSQRVKYGFTNFTATDGVNVPVIVAQPQSKTVNLGSNAVLAVVALGIPALSYRWYFNSTNLVASTSSNTLSLTNVQSGHAGSYSVVVTNASGATTSSVARLTVLAPPTLSVKLDRDSTNIQLVGKGIPYQSYGIQYTPGIKSTAWQEIISTNANETGAFVCVDALRPGVATNRFYRAFAK